jgi:hypothetical protein
MITQLAAVGRFVADWFKTDGERKRERLKSEDDALSALYAAVNETRLYIHSLDPTRYVGASKSKMIDAARKRSRETEEKLSRLWMHAAVKLRRVDADLADRCYVKAEYWVTPERWSEDDIKRARIGIDRVYKEARALL